MVKKSEYRTRLRGSWLAAMLLMTTAVANAQTAGPSSPRPNSQAYPLATLPQLDGDVLNDSAWRDVVPTSDFWQI